MAKEDADAVKWHLDEATKKSAPLKDKDLTRKIKEASEHIEKKLDPTKG